MIIRSHKVISRNRCFSYRNDNKKITIISFDIFVRNETRLSYQPIQWQNLCCSYEKRTFELVLFTKLYTLSIQNWSRKITVPLFQNSNLRLILSHELLPLSLQKHSLLSEHYPSLYLTAYLFAPWCCHCLIALFLLCHPNNFINFFIKNSKTLGT